MPKLPGGLRGEQFAIKNGLDSLLEDNLKALQPKYAEQMLRPLFDRIRRKRATGNDQADLQELLNELPALFPKIKADAVLDATHAMLVQASLLGKGFVLAAVAYVIMPADAIPDLAPILGWLDDLGVMVLAFAYLANVLGDYREQ